MTEEQRDIIRMLKYGTIDIEELPEEELTEEEKQWIEEDEDYSLQVMMDMLDIENISDN